MRGCKDVCARACRTLPGVSGCKSVWRGGMQKEEALLQLQGRFPAAPRQCPGMMRTGGKLLHVIARSGATWQSVLLAAAQNEKQHFGRIRNALRIRPSSSQLVRHPLRQGIAMQQHFRRIRKNAFELPPQAKPTRLRPRRGGLCLQRVGDKVQPSLAVSRLACKFSLAAESISLIRLSWLTSEAPGS